MKHESEKDFHFPPYMYDCPKTINTISNAIDTDEVDKIIEHFIESVSVLYLRKDILHELYLLIEKELFNKNNHERNNKMKRALELIESHI